MASNSYSLDYWRKLFRSTNTNIFEVVENAVLIAATDYPTEFAYRRDELVERIFTCRPDYRSWLPSGGEENDEKEREEERREQKVGNELRNGEAPSNEVEEASRVVSEITRIKNVLKNWREESESVLLESLQRLQSMEISIQILKETKIGRTVKHLMRHESEEIQLLAQALIDGWRNVVKDWANEGINSEDPAPDSASKPTNVEEGGLAFPPWDEAALLAPQTTSMELTRIFDGIDDNGNIENCGRSQENGRRRLPKGEGEFRKRDASSIQVRPLEACNRLPEPHYYGEKRRSETSRQIKPLDAPRPPKPYAEGKRRMQDFSPSQQRSLEGHIRLPKLHDLLQGNNHKHIEDDSEPSAVPGRPPRTAFEHKAGAETKFQHNQGHSQIPKTPPSAVQAVTIASEVAPQQYDDWFLAQKLETAKRKLQGGYQQAENAKRQRTIQMVEQSNMPKHSQNPRQPSPNVRDRIMKKLVKRH